ncbi:MAG: deoxyribose-phosphate aldolase [Planctomycetaceae bacterium]
MPDPRLLAALRCLDLTSLGEDDTPERIDALCRAAASPGDALPPVAAVCVSARFVGQARSLLTGTGVRVACATGAFPSGRLDTAGRVAEIAAALEAGADEIDTVLDHRAVVEGRMTEVLAQLVASREACGTVTMKVILETGALPSLAQVRSAAALALDAGADFLKTSTGKVHPGATPEAVLAIAEVVRVAGTTTGIKVSGGVRTVQDAIGYLGLVTRHLGAAWGTHERFRIGASSLLDALVSALAAPD